MLRRVNDKGLISVDGRWFRRLAAVTGLSAAACGAAASTPQTAQNYPSYDPHSAELFDNGIEPEAVGFPTDHTNTPGSDNRLRERSQTGDAVVRARVMTVDEDGTQNWQLAFHTIEVLHVAGGNGGRAPAGPPDFTLHVQPTDPAAGIVGSMSTHLVGRTFVVFMRSFTHTPTAAEAHGGEAIASGQPDVHFHMAPDSKDETEAIRNSILLREVQ
jgi:hypothetical protein